MGIVTVPDPDPVIVWCAFGAIAIFFLIVQIISDYRKRAWYEKTYKDYREYVERLWYGTKARSKPPWANKE